MKNTLSVIFLALALSMPQNSRCSVVTINNTTMVKVEATLDIIAYPDPKKSIGNNSKITVDIGSFFMRGITVGVHIGDQFFENVLSESLGQSLGLGDIEYHIFTEIENKGRERFVDEHVLEFTFYLVRSPRLLFPGGIVSKSAPIKVRTTNFETFKSVKNDSVLLPTSSMTTGYASTTVR